MSWHGSGINAREAYREFLCDETCGFDDTVYGVEDDGYFRSICPDCGALIEVDLG